MSEHALMLEQAAARTGTTSADKALRHWLAGLSNAEKIDFLKRLWPLNARYALQLTQGARLSRRESEGLFRHWLRSGQHNTAKDLITYFVPVLGEERFWRVASEEELTLAMRDFMNYHSQGRLSLNPEK